MRITIIIHDIEAINNHLYHIGTYIPKSRVVNIDLTEKQIEKLKLNNGEEYGEIILGKEE